MSPPPKLLDRVREAIRTRHYSRRTEEAYVHWIRRYIVSHGKAHPSTLGAAEISAFLTWLAVGQHVSASTQNQAMSAILFLYRKVLGVEIGAIEHVPRARTPERLPVVLNREEVIAVLKQLAGTMKLVLHGYLLSQTHPVGRFKARFFGALGYTAERWQEFEADLRIQHLTQDAQPGESMTEGQVFTIRAILKGPNGQSAVVQSVWFIAAGREAPRFVTAYPGGTK